MSAIAVPVPQANIRHNDGRSCLVKRLQPGPEGTGLRHLGSALAQHKSVEREGVGIIVNAEDANAIQSGLSRWWWRSLARHWRARKMT
jgi:hypothetical protein